MSAEAAPVVPPGAGENNSGELITSLTVVGSLSFVIMVLRFFCKGRYAKQFGIDDGLLGLAWCCLMAYITLVCLGTRYGLGMHIFDPAFDFSVLPTANKYLFVGEFFGIVGITVAKTSFCFTLLRLSVAKWHKWLIWTCIVTVNLVMWPCAISFFVGCTPLEKKWDDTIEGHCIDNTPIVHYAVFAGVYSAITDFVLAIFPWALVWNLQMRQVEKIGVCVCMSMGVLSGIFAIVKSAFLPPSLSDYTFKSTPLLIWSAAELSIVIMASSIPFLRLFWKELKEKTTSASRSRNKSGYAMQNDSYHLGSVNNNGKKMGTTSKIRTHRASHHPELDSHKRTQDDDSDKSILAPSRNMQHRIVRTDEVRIESTAANAKDGANSERSFYNDSDNAV